MVEQDEGVRIRDGNRRISPLGGGKHIAAGRSEVGGVDDADRGNAKLLGDFDPVVDGAEAGQMAKAVVGVEAADRGRTALETHVR